MKTLILLLTLASVAAHAQAVLRVNNTPGVNAPYINIADAVAAAGVNDIIMVEASSLDYGAGVNCYKKVTIVGPGYFLDENTGQQVNNNAATVSFIELRQGSDGSSVSGLRLGSLGVTRSSNISLTNNLVLSNINLDADIGTCSNIAVQRNYIVAGINSVNTVFNTVISNNLIGGSVNVHANASFNLVNNVFASANNSNHFLRNSFIQNNIFLGSGSLGSTSGSSFSNNLFVSPSQAGADASNIFNVNPASLFLGLTGNTTDTQWKLKAASPAIGAGIGGIDCGMYGGSNAYKPSGIATGQHTVYNLLVPATVIQNGTLNVKVSAKVN